MSEQIHEMAEIRGKIDLLDTRIMSLLVYRIKHVETLLYMKRQNNIPISDEERERWILDRVQAVVRNSGCIGDQEKRITEDIMQIYTSIFKTMKKKGKV